MDQNNPNPRVNQGMEQIKREAQDDLEHENAESPGPGGGINPNVNASRSGDVAGQSRYGNVGVNNPGTSAPMDAPGTNRVNVHVNQQGSMGVNTNSGSSASRDH